MQPLLTESLLADLVVMPVQAELSFSRTPAFMLPVNSKLTFKLIVVLGTSAINPTGRWQCLAKNETSFHPV